MMQVRIDLSSPCRSFSHHRAPFSCHPRESGDPSFLREGRGSRFRRNDGKQCGHDGTETAPSAIVLAVLLLTLAACAGPKPILYPNDHLQAVGEEAAQDDIAECRELAEAAGASENKGKAGQVAGSTAIGGAVGAASGAVGGAVVGAAGRGSAIGAAAGATWGLLRGLFWSRPPSQAYRAFVDRCLMDRGYEPVGWE